jgi:hypothetical protein
VSLISSTIQDRGSGAALTHRLVQISHHKSGPATRHISASQRLLFLILQGRGHRIFMATDGERPFLAAVQLVDATLSILKEKESKWPRTLCCRELSIRVRFTPESGHVRRTSPCLLWVRSGHSGHYSITSSAATSRPAGTVRSSFLAVFKLRAVSYLVGVCTGSSAGLAPRRIRST